ncbi:MAG: hypothetical protein AB7S72_19240 [Draconibacterium sp.]
MKTQVDGFILAACVLYFITDLVRIRTVECERQEQKNLPEAVHFLPAHRILFEENE